MTKNILFGVLPKSRSLDFARDDRASCLSSLGNCHAELAEASCRRRRTQERRFGRHAILFAVAAVLFAVGCNPAAEKPAAAPTAKETETIEMVWLTDFQEAQRVAAAEKRPILVDFSGSDWCGWCIRLDEEVFSQAAFQEYARKNLVLFVADFPRGKELPEKLQAQNEELAKKYGIRGFPTVLLLDAAGGVTAQTGYRAGGAEAYVTHLRDLLSEET